MYIYPYTIYVHAYYTHIVYTQHCIQLRDISTFLISIAQQPKVLCDTSFLAITIMMNEFYSGELKMDIISPTWTMWDNRLPAEALFKQ